MPVPVRGGPGVTGDDRLGRQPLVQLVVDAPWVDAVGVVEHRLGVHLVLPLDHVLGDPLLPRQVGLLVQMRDQREERLLHVAPHVQLGRVPQAHLLRFEIHLDRARLAALGQELGVGIVRAEQHQGVAVFHLMLAGTGAEQPELLGVERHIRGNDLLGTQRCDDAGTAQFRRRQHLVGGAVRPVSDQEGDLGARVGARHPVRRFQFRHLHSLHVVRQHDHGWAQAHQRRSERDVDDGLRLLRCHDRLDVDRDVFHRALQVVFLLLERAQRTDGLLAHDRDDGLVVALGVVQPVEHVEGAR